MAHPGAYRGNKRQKELKRLEKQEAKRLRRMGKKPEHAEDAVEGEPSDLTAAPDTSGLQELEETAHSPATPEPAPSDPVEKPKS